MSNEEPDGRSSSLPVAVPSWRTAVDGHSGAVVGSSLPLVVLVVLVVTWHAVVVVYEIPTLVLPSPVDVGAALLETYPTLLEDAAVTAATAGAGLLVGGTVGLVLAFVMTYSRRATSMLLPYVLALRIAPIIAIAPLLFLWFGRGIPVRAALVATLTLFPMTVATLDGLRSTPTSYTDLMRSVGAPRTAVFLRVRVPAAAPSVFAGLKIATTLSVIGAVVSEFVTLEAGLGYRVFHASTYLRTAESFAALLVLSTLGVVFYLVPAVLERRYRDQL
ncbi:ABC transporter permease [Halalkalicoccus salilacus]|uniref:ABC transporter permease n=1 Tax=Halalkalicoccus salilacus TaxID=3117459 RepID=UPI00300EE62C